MSSMNTQIITAWDMYESLEPEISTERLMQIVADYCHCDIADVASAITYKSKTS